MLWLQVDEKKLSETRDWLMGQQGKDGCFLSVGKLLHKSMQVQNTLLINQLNVRCGSVVTYIYLCAYNILDQEVYVQYITSTMYTFTRQRTYMVLACTG